MKKINFHVSVKNLDGKAIKQGDKEVLLSESISNMLAMAKPEKDAIRQLDVALKIHNSKEAIELDDADITMIKSVVEKSGLSTLIIGQIMKLLAGKESKESGK